MLAIREEIRAIENETSALKITRSKTRRTRSRNLGRRMDRAHTGEQVASPRFAVRVDNTCLRSTGRQRAWRGGPGNLDLHPAAMEEYAECG